MLSMKAKQALLVPPPIVKIKKKVHETDMSLAENFFQFAVSPGSCRFLHGKEDAATRMCFDHYFYVFKEKVLPSFCLSDLKSFVTRMARALGLSHMLFFLA